jgi:glycosyltransferase involved in cell wall biosynthesis
MKKLRCVVVTNVPTPYRLPVWDIMAASGEVDLHVIYCAGAHIDPSKDGKTNRYGVHFLTAAYKAFATRFSHADFGVLKLLSILKPDVVVTTGFIPTFMFAFVWSFMHRVPHVSMTDGTLETESSLGLLHRVVRKLVFAHTKAFVGACEGSSRLYRSYGVESRRIFVSALCADNSLFRSEFENKKYDFLFCGRYLDIKNPIFAIDVAKKVAEKIGRRVSLRFVGKGDMESAMRAEAQAASQWVDVSFAGYLPQEDLPREYSASRVFLFPTSMDCWGVVVNEACAAGVPCVVSPHTGVAGELVRDGVTGFVCALDQDAWVLRCAQLLSDEGLRAKLSDAAMNEVQRYSFDNASRGLLNALQLAADK